MSSVRIFVVVFHFVDEILQFLVEMKHSAEHSADVIGHSLQSFFADRGGGLVVGPLFQAVNQGALKMAEVRLEFPVRDEAGRERGPWSLSPSGPMNPVWSSLPALQT